MGKLASSPSRARNFALVGHRSSGKTSLAEQLLASGGAVRQAGRVEEGTALLDFLPIERRRHMSLQSSYAWLQHQESRLFLTDVPGGAAAAPERSIAGACGDLRLVVVGATDGVEQGTRRELARKGSCFAVVSKMDRAHAHEWPATVKAIQDACPGRKAQPIQIPWFERGTLAGVVDLVTQLLTARDGSVVPIPAELQSEVRAAREALIEAVAMHDDSLLEVYLELFDLDEAMLEEGLARAVAGGRLMPLLFTSAAAGVGGGELLDAIVRFGPPPIARAVPLVDRDGAPVVASEDGAFAAQVLAIQEDASGELYQVLRVWSGCMPSRGALSWDGGSRSVRKVYSLRGPRRKVADYVGPGAVVATWDLAGARPGDVVWQAGQAFRSATTTEFRPAVERRVVVDSRHHDRMERTLRLLQTRDRGLSVRFDGPSAAVVGGVNSLHLERALEQLAEVVRFETSLPMVPYREAPMGSAVGHFEHQKVVGGEPLEFARVELHVRPLSGPGVRFSVTADDEALPTKWHEAIERGVMHALGSGPSAGYPVDGLEVVCTDGDYDLFASEECWFEIAASEALRGALTEAKTSLIEPLFEVMVEVPSGRVGDVLAEIGSRGGRVFGLESPGERTRISVELPYRQLRTLGSRLESITGGDSQLEAAQSGMAPVPAQALAQALRDAPNRPRTPAGSTLRTQRPVTALTSG